MKRGLLIAAAAMWIAAGSTAAHALEPAQSAAIDRLAAAHTDLRDRAASMARHYALLLWVEDYCSGDASQSVRAYLLEHGTSDRDAFEAGWMDTFELLNKTDPKAMCALALDQYGPNGMLVPGAWRHKP